MSFDSTSHLPILVYFLVHGSLGPITYPNVYSFAMALGFVSCLPFSIVLSHGSLVSTFTLVGVWHLLVIHWGLYTWHRCLPWNSLWKQPMRLYLACPLTYTFVTVLSPMSYTLNLLLEGFCYALSWVVVGAW